MEKNAGENRRIGAVNRRLQAPYPKMGKRVQFDGYHELMTKTDNPRKKVKKRRKKISLEFSDVFELNKHELQPFKGQICKPARSSIPIMCMPGSE